MNSSSARRRSGGRRKRKTKTLFPFLHYVELLVKDERGRERKKNNHFHSLLHPLHRSFGAATRGRKKGEKKEKGVSFVAAISIDFALENTEEEGEEGIHSLIFHRYARSQKKEGIEEREKEGIAHTDSGNVSYTMDVFAAGFPLGEGGDGGKKREDCFFSSVYIRRRPLSMIGGLRERRGEKRGGEKKRFASTVSGTSAIHPLREEPTQRLT